MTSNTLSQSVRKVMLLTVKHGLDKPVHHWLPRYGVMTPFVHKPPTSSSKHGIESDADQLQSHIGR